MLAVAAYRDSAEQGTPRQEEIKLKRKWVHGLGEGTTLADASVDMYVLSYVVHELPQQAIRGKCLITP